MEASDEHLSPTADKTRSAFFVDGYNLYNGMKENGLYEFIWLDLEWLLKRMLIQWTNKQEKLEYVKYFTAFPDHDKDRALRHKTYTSALSNKCNATLHIVGDFSQAETSCSICKQTYRRWNEKQTDVSIAIHLLQDAREDKYDTAYLVTADTDQLPTIKMFREQFPKKKIGMFFPPGRYLQFLKDSCHFGEEISDKAIKKCQLENPIVLTSGAKIEKPKKWSRPRT